MPLYEYQCGRTGRRLELLRRYEDRKFCPCGCGAKRLISAPAKTAMRWGDTPLDGRYDRGLGTTLRDKNHRAQIMQARGLRELQEGEVEAEISRAEKESAAHDVTVQSFKHHLAETGDTGLAIARTFPCDGALE